MLATRNRDLPEEPRIIPSNTYHAHTWQIDASRHAGKRSTKDCSVPASGDTLSFPYGPAAAHRVRPRAGKPRLHGNGAGARRPWCGSAESRAPCFRLRLHARHPGFRHDALASDRLADRWPGLELAPPPRSRRGRDSSYRGGSAWTRPGYLAYRARPETQHAPAQAYRTARTRPHFPSCRRHPLRAGGDLRSTLPVTRGNRRTLRAFLVGRRRPCDLGVRQPRPPDPAPHPGT